MKVWVVQGYIYIIVWHWLLCVCCRVGDSALSEDVKHCWRGTSVMKLQVAITKYWRPTWVALHTILHEPQTLRWTGWHPLFLLHLLTLYPPPPPHTHTHTQKNAVVIYWNHCLSLWALFRKHLLNRWTFCNQTCYGGAWSGPGVSCRGKKRLAATSFGQDMVSFVNLWNLIWGRPVLQAHSAYRIVSLE